MLQLFFRKVITRFYKPLLAYYLKKTRSYSHKPFRLTILPGVFHPGLFYSTNFLLKYVTNLDLNQKSVIEVGAGNGLISFHAALKAKNVVALEISKIAIEGLVLNKQNNCNVLPSNVLQIVESDLFKSLPNYIYDYIIVNPPYYPNNAKNEADLAWNCGEEFEYFKCFFNQVGQFMSSYSTIIMVLSSQCNLNKIAEIAVENGFEMQLKSQKYFLIEDNFIFEIKQL